MSDTESNEVAGYASLVGRTVMVGMRVAEVTASAPAYGVVVYDAKFKDGSTDHFFRDEFYVLPTQEEIAEAIDPEPEDKGPDNPWTLWIRRKDSREQQAAAVLALLTGGEEGEV